MKYPDQSDTETPSATISVGNAVAEQQGNAWHVYADGEHVGVVHQANGRWAANGEAFESLKAAVKAFTE